MMDTASPRDLPIRPSRPLRIVEPPQPSALLVGIGAARRWIMAPTRCKETDRQSCKGSATILSIGRRTIAARRHRAGEGRPALRGRPRAPHSHRCRRPARSAQGPTPVAVRARLPFPKLLAPIEPQAQRYYPLFCWGHRSRFRYGGAMVGAIRCPLKRASRMPALFLAGLPERYASLAPSFPAHRDPHSGRNAPCPTIAGEAQRRPSRLRRRRILSRPATRPSGLPCPSLAPCRAPARADPSPLRVLSARSGLCGAPRREGRA
jgi:hypothetical protein